MWVQGMWNLLCIFKLEAFDVTMLAVIFQGRPKSWTLIFKLKAVLYMSLVSAHWSCNSRTGA